jgi:hypothetical protein
VTDTVEVAADTSNGTGTEAARLNELVTTTLSGLINRTTEVERGLIALIGEVLRLHDTVKTTNAWHRRDLGYAADVAAATTSAAFVQEHLPTALAFADPRSTLRHATGLVTVPGLALEFGVATGSTLSFIVEALPGYRVYGFDVFSGLPEDWRTGFSAGMFAQLVPLVAGAQIVAGLFADTLPGFMAAHPEPVAFLHLDADLYSSTATVLDHVGPRLGVGAIVIFDEYFNYPSWPQHEHKAWQEFVERSGIGFRYEAYTANDEQLVVRITEPARR